ncbi:MAG: type II CAAX endopeptidase family protein [Actinomycetota bacterium]|nr:type II CAAX endopeptidase family protein [Actinomycetota bacterium]
MNPGLETCYVHANRVAVAKCVICGRLVCASCRRIVGNRNYCQTCANAILYAQPNETGYQEHKPPIGKTSRSENSFPEAKWGVGEALIIFGIALLVVTALGAISTVLLSAVGATSASSNPEAFVILTFITSAIFYALLYFGVSYSVGSRHGGSLGNIGLGNGCNFLESLKGLALGVPLFFVAILVEKIWQFIIGPTKDDMLTKSLQGGVGPFYIFILFVTIVVLAPLFEEIFFRGYLFPAMGNQLGVRNAMIMNGIVFAALHTEGSILWVIGFIPRFLIGLCACYLYAKNRSISAPVALHATYNGLVFLSSIIFHI